MTVVEPFARWETFPVGVRGAVKWITLRTPDSILEQLPSFHEFARIPPVTRRSGQRRCRDRTSDDLSAHGD